jgi:hypothetical protein
MSAEGKKNLDKISSSMRSDADKFGTMPRFGYFSIPHSSYFGDGFYSVNRRKIRKVEKNVITDPRGIFTNPGKKGNGVDIYFKNDFKVNDDTLKKLEDAAEKEKNDLLNKVKQSKIKNTDNFRPNFKPGGPQYYKDFYDTNPKTYDVPITKEVDKKKKIDKEKKSVVTEPRGIYTRPMKIGDSTTPGICFSEYTMNQAQLDELKKQSETEKKPKKEEDTRKDDRFQFKPASLKRNEAFQNDKDLYGEEDNKVKTLLETAIEVKVFHVGPKKTQG